MEDGATRTEGGSGEQWRRVADAYHSALERPVDERDAFLSAALAGEPELLARARALIDSHRRAPDFLERPAVEASGLVAGADRSGDDGEGDEPVRIGPYRVVERIGAGGMGAVYLARRDDRHYRQQVAVKLVKRGMDTDQVLARFRAERQILASLEHPGIARLLDGGVTEDGRPYFVLEHVEDALPIDRHCAERGLPVADRLALFLQVCEAVSYAHRKLIVHRDLKPSNLLVSGEGRVKLLDFGIAKLLDPALADVTAIAPTRTEQRLLTPEYASPEQIRGEPLSTTSDVYALGVVLFELLTGEMPYRLEGRTPLAVAEAIRDQEPEKPSAVIDRRRRSGGHADAADPPIAGTRLRDDELPSGRLPNERLPKDRLPSDLDNIVLKALRKEPEQRYASVAELAADVERFLAHRPVLARPRTLGYRVQRFVQRNALATALAGLAALLLLGGLAATVWQARIAREERDRARAEARKAERTATVLSDLFRLSTPSGNAGEMTLSDFAQQAERQALQGLELPEVRSRLESVLGDFNRDLARYERSRELFETALATQRRLYPDGHPDLAATLHGLGSLLVAQQEWERARDLLEEALAMRRRLFGDGLAAAETLQALAEPRSLLLDEAGSERAVREALDIRRRLLPPDDPRLGESLGSLAVQHYRRGEFGEAARLCRQALEILRLAHGEISQAAAHELNNLGAILAADGRYQEALEVHREALRVRSELYGAEHPYVAYSYGHLGSLMQQLGRPAEAAPLLRRALAIRENHHGSDHRLVAQSLLAVAAADADLGDRVGAERRIRRALAIQQSLQPGAPAVGDALVELGRHRSSAGEFAAALEPLERAVGIYRSTLGADHHRTAVAQVALARALVGEGRLREAERLIDGALLTLEAELRPGHPELASAHRIRGDLRRAQGRPDAASASYREALRLWGAHLPPEHRDLVETEARLDAARRAAAG